jgi:hypothetical protein
MNVVLSFRMHFRMKISSGVCVVVSLSLDALTYFHLGIAYTIDPEFETEVRAYLGMRLITHHDAATGMVLTFNIELKFIIHRL